MEKIQEVLSRKIEESSTRFDSTLCNVSAKIAENFDQLEAYIKSLKKENRPVWESIAEMFKETYGKEVSVKYIRVAFSRVKRKNLKSPKNTSSAAPAKKTLEAPKKALLPSTTVNHTESEQKVLVSGGVDRFRWEIYTDKSSKIWFENESVAYSKFGKKIDQGIPFGMSYLIKVKLNEEETLEMKKFIETHSNTYYTKNQLLEVYGGPTLAIVECNFRSSEFLNAYAEIVGR